MEYVTIAKILGTHGLKGLFRCYSLTSFPEERFQLRRKLTLHNEKTGVRLDVTLSYCRQQANVFILGFEEITSIEQAESYLKWDIDINKDEAPIPEDHYRIADLLGCEVFAQDGKKLGEVKDVFSYSPTWTLRVKREEQKDFFVPFVDQFVKTVDTANKRIVIEPIEGLL